LDFAASRVIVTVPLGVLQAGRPAIEPMPKHIAQALQQLRMGHALRFSLLFREPFWTMLEEEPALKDLGFLLSLGEMPPVWWTTNPEPTPLLTGWVGGPRSSALAGLSAEELAERACGTLARIFDIERVQIRAMLVGCYMHDWSRDPFALGAYSYVAAGGLDASRALAEPVDDTLFFAGEHTDTTGHWGTVHAAMRSGLRAAQQALSSS
ncbi:MAG TPA: NAD(P)/FAD-dependent oxidoreductase, partial [Edaphobacter sp.]